MIGYSNVRHALTPPSPGGRGGRVQNNAMTQSITRKPGISNQGIGAVLDDPRTERRGIAFIVLLATLLPLVVGAALHANHSGVGTHEQLGLPACNFLVVTGYPCVSCGMTTAVALAAQGHLMQALVVQPAGALLALSLAATSMVAAWCVITGASLKPLYRRLGKLPTLIVIIAVLLGAWGYKVVTMAAWS